MSNLIRAEMLPTEYCPEPHLVITIDGTPLDQLIADSTENSGLLGLIPAWLDDLTDPAERAVVWNRIDQPNGSNVAVPVLMCPDDLDFWCTVVLADTTFSPDFIIWHALGVHAGGSEGLPDSIGCEVNWFTGAGPFQFSREDYDSCVAKFKLNLEASGR